LPYLKEYKYEERVVCFIDVLGFSDRIKQTENEPNGSKVLSDTCNALNLMDTFMANLLKKNYAKDMRVTQFSDSLVISFPLKESEYNILSALYTIKSIQVMLLMLFRMLLRDGIVVGKVVHTDQLLVGPAMISAYRLESKSAVYPRIVIDPVIITLFYHIKLKLPDQGKTYDSIVRKDLDDLYYIDYFNFDNGDRCFEDEKEFLRYFKTLLKMIIDSLKKSDIGIRSKYYWMRNKLKDSNRFDTLQESISHFILSKLE